MEAIKKAYDLAVENGEIKPRLSLFAKDTKGVPRSTGPHTVILKDSERVNGKDFEGNERPEMKLTLTEGGVDKTYNFPMRTTNGNIHYLIERLADIKEGTEVVLEGKNNGSSSYIEVSVDGVQSVDTEEPKEIPVIQEGDDVSNVPF